MEELLVHPPHVRAQLALGKSPIYDLREVTVHADGETLELFGQVDSFYHKQLAQEAVRAVANGFHIINSITVGESAGSRKPR